LSFVRQAEHAILMGRIVFLLSVATLLAAGSACTSSPRMSQADHKIEFLYFDGCPHSPAMRARLEQALAIVGREPVFVEVDLNALPPDDPRLRFGAPTVLLDGEDLLGHAPLDKRALSCRIYPEGLPSASELATHLRFQRRAPDSGGAT
jgi:hypothetical protein